MVVDLVGVLELGGPRGALVPVDARAPLSIPRGTNLTVRVAVLTSAGVKQALTGTLALTVRKRPQTPALLTKAGTIVGLNRADFAFLPADWTTIEPSGAGGAFFYNVALVQSSQTNLIVPTSPLVVLP